MQRLAAIVIAVVACAMFAYSPLQRAQAGAKEGKMRWSHKQTGGCKWHEAIKVPESKDSKPGIYKIQIEFKAKELAEFFVIGDGDTDLDLVVKDSKGKIVAKDEDSSELGSDLCMCRWTPERNEVFTIYIVNRGKIFNVACAGCN